MYWKKYTINTTYTEFGCHVSNWQNDNIIFGNDLVMIPNSRKKIPDSMLKQMYDAIIGHYMFQLYAWFAMLVIVAIALNA